MTDDPIGEEIPELVDQLEGALNAPNPAAIHAGLGQRQAARKRTLGVAGVFVAVLTIGSAAFALTNDDGTSTVTAADAAGLAPTTNSAVADNSAPIEEGPVAIPGVVVNSWSDAIETAIQISQCSNGARIQTDGSTWLPGRISQVWADDSPGQVRAIIRGDLLIAIDDAGNAARFFRRTPGTAVGEPCNEFSEPFPGGPIDLVPARLPILAALGDIPISDGNGLLTLVSQEDRHGLLEFSSLCRGGVGYLVLWDDEGFTVVDQAPQPSIDESVTSNPVRCAGPPPRLDLFEIGDTVTVTVSPDLVLLDVAGDTRWQLVLDRQTSATISVDDETASTTSTTLPPESPAPPPTTPPTTTTTAALTGPPAFAPTEDARLSGDWTVLRMWDQGVPFTFDGDTGQLLRLDIVGRQLGGHDGCNGHGGGIFYATPDGDLELKAGSSTNVGCPTNTAYMMFAGAMQADRWGLTSTGNLVLDGDVVTAEFERTEASPQTPIVGVSAPLNTIWNSDVLHDYQSASTDWSEIEITMREDTVLLEVEDCSTPFAFDVSYGGQSEGSISLDRSEDPSASCELTADVELALDTLARADYFATAYGGVMFWDGPQPLAIFAAE